MAPDAHQETGWEIVETPADGGPDVGLGPERDETRRRQKIRDFAAEHGLDLATAYAVLAGLETLEEALERLPVSGRSIRPRPNDAPEARSRETVPDETDGSHGPRLPYDRAFQVAIDSGYLSIQEAIERGNRDSYAEHLSRRHFLPFELALHVADNRVRLHEAVMATFADEETGEDPGAVQRRRGQGLVFFLAVLMAAALGLHGWQNWVSHEDRDREAYRRLYSAPAVAPAEQVVTDDGVTPAPRAVAAHDRDTQGRIIRVVGAHPRSVLGEFCDGLASQRASLQPVSVVPTTPPYPGTRLGIIRDTADGTLYSVPIRMDARDGAWTMGDGASPIAANPYRGTLPSRSQGTTERRDLD